MALLFELRYPSPVFTKNGNPIELPGGPYLSTDGFIYFRCGIILPGEEAVNELLKDPNNIMEINKSPVEIDAEGLLYCATDTLKNKRSKVNLDDSPDRSEHFPELIKYYN